MTLTRCYRCQVCGAALPAWLPAPQAPDGGLLLGHLSQHPDEVGASLDRMRTTDDITPVSLEAYEVVEEETQ
jgi:dissimilatory sulfite reductase (desulfoviridin) alpha/beta subunit